MMLRTLEELQVKQEEISSLGRACQETSKALRLSDTLSLRGSLPAVFSFSLLFCSLTGLVRGLGHISCVLCTFYYVLHLQIIR